MQLRNKQHLSKIQKGLYQRLREELGELLGEVPYELKQYHREYVSSLPRSAVVSSLNDFRLAIRKKNIFLCGDYHSSATSQKNFLWFAAEVAKQKKNLVILLEAFDVSSTPLIEKFLAGSLSEKQFLLKTRFVKTWGFDWENYRAIFEWAKKNNVTIHGTSFLNRKKSLEKKDEDFASEVIKTLASRTDGSVLVLAGDLHVCSEHLVKKLPLEYQSQTFLLHQDIDTLFFKFASVFKPHLILKLNSFEFCLLTEPPWEKVRSEISFYENPQKNKTQKVFPLFAMPSLEEEAKDLVAVLCETFSITPFSCDELQIVTEVAKKTFFLHSIFIEYRKSHSIYFYVGLFRDESIYLIAAYFFLLKLNKKLLAKPLKLNALAIALVQLIFLKPIPCVPALRRSARRISASLAAREPSQIFSFVETLA